MGGQWDLAAIAPVDFVAVVILRIVRCRHDNARSTSQCRHTVRLRETHIIEHEQLAAKTESETDHEGRRN